MATIKRINLSPGSYAEGGYLSPTHAARVNRLAKPKKPLGERIGDVAVTILGLLGVALIGSVLIYAIVELWRMILSGS